MSCFCGSIHCSCLFGYFRVKMTVQNWFLNFRRPELWEDTQREISVKEMHHADQETIKVQLWIHCVAGADTSWDSWLRMFSEVF